MSLMKLLRPYLASLILMGSLLALAADASAAARVYIRVGPPAPIVERRSVAPGPRHVWVPGFYRYEPRGYVWVPGQWAVPPRARAAWVPGHWIHERRGWYFVEGHWR
jgi:hypothetical protein